MSHEGLKLTACQDPQPGQLPPASGVTQPRGGSLFEGVTLRPFSAGVKMAKAPPTEQEVYLLRSKQLQLSFGFFFLLLKASTAAETSLIIFPSISPAHT